MLFGRMAVAMMFRKMMKAMVFLGVEIVPQELRSFNHLCLTTARRTDVSIAIYYPNKSPEFRRMGRSLLEWIETRTPTA